MQAKFRLKKNYQYNYVYNHAKSVSDKLFVVLYCTSNVTQTKVGFSVSKKYGHAVQRNRMRRQMKSAVMHFAESLADGYNVVVIPRRQEEYAFDDITASLTHLFEKAGLLK